MMGEKKPRSEPVEAKVMIYCDRQECLHRTGKGFCGVGDPHWDWHTVEHTTHTVKCWTYDSRG